MAWLVIERNNNPNWLTESPEQQALLIEKLKEELKKGVQLQNSQILFPLLDLADTSTVSETDVWNEDVPRLKEASKRYNANAILIGRFSHDTQEWIVRWTFLQTETKRNWTDNAFPLISRLFPEEANKAHIEANKGNFEETKGNIEANNLNAATNKENDNDDNDWFLAVSGVLGAEQYNQVVEFLQHIPTVTAVEINQILPEKTVFNIKASGNKEIIKKSISESQLLIEVPGTISNEASNSDNDNTLHYQIRTAL